MRPPFETFKKPTCRGSLALGTGCGTCEKCVWERERIVSAVDANPAWVERLKQERDDLFEKWTKLDDFTDHEKMNPTFAAMPATAKALLVAQREIMHAYLTILDARLATS